jgi:uncharacterized membrane protein
MRTHRIHSVTAAIGLLLSAGAPLHAGDQAPFFMGLGGLPGSPRQESSPGGLSPDGRAVVGSAFGLDGTFQAMRWTAEDGMIGLGTILPYRGSVANAASNGGNVVVGWGYNDIFADTRQAFRWTPTDGLQAMGDLPGGIFYSNAFDITPDGSVIVGKGNSFGGWEAFRWTAETGPVGLGYLPGGGLFSSAAGVSADGSVIVGASRSPLGQEAFRWTADLGMQPLGFLPGGQGVSGAAAVSADGRVIVGSSNSGPGGFTARAYRWTAEEGMVALPPLPDGVNPIFAGGVSGDGSIIVGDTTQSGPFIWDAVNGSRYLVDFFVKEHGLDLTGWTLVGVSGISADGLTFAGGGLFEVSPGQFLGQACVAHIPEPGTISLFSLGFFLSMTNARRRPRRGAWVAHIPEPASGLLFLGLIEGDELGDDRALWAAAYEPLP